MKTPRVRHIVPVGLLALLVGLATACAGDDVAETTTTIAPPADTTTIAPPVTAAPDDTTTTEPTSPPPTETTSEPGDDDELRARLIAMVVADDPQVGPDEAECFVDILMAEIDHDVLREAMDSAEALSDPDVFDEIVGFVESEEDFEVLGRIFSCFDS